MSNHESDKRSKTNVSVNCGSRSSARAKMKSRALCAVGGVSRGGRRERRWIVQVREFVSGREVRERR